MSGKLLTCWERVAASSLGDKSISYLVYEQLLNLLQARFCGTSRDANIVLCQTVGRRIWAWGQNFWFISQDRPRLLSWTFGVVTERVWSPTEATSVLADPWKEDKELQGAAPLCWKKPVDVVWVPDQDAFWTPSWGDILGRDPSWRTRLGKRTSGYLAY